MASLWGKEFLIFLNLLKYAAFVALAAYFMITVVRMVKRGGR